MENELVIAPASESDIPEIRLMARETFYPTYRDILSPEQLDYMYEWMYSAESLSRQMHSGHRFFIARDGNPPQPCKAFTDGCENAPHSGPNCNNTATTSTGTAS